MSTLKQRLVFILIVICLVTMPAMAQDVSYGANGFAFTDFSNLGFSSVEARPVEIQTDGKIVVGGGTSITSPSLNDFCIARLTTIGAPDVTFGNGGRVVTSFNALDTLMDIAIQPDGKIVAVGVTRLSAGVSIAIARYTTSGNLDTTFGASGRVMSFIGSTGVVRTVKIQRDGNILVAGKMFGSSTFDFFIKRFLPSGGIDTSFGSNGTVRSDLGGDDEIFSLAIQSDGKIIAAGQTVFNSDGRFATMRYTSSGQRDSSFGGTGVIGAVITNFQSNDHGGSPGDGARGVAIQGDGKIVVVGQTENDTGLALVDIAVVRYTASGFPDITFGPASNGRITFAFDSSVRQNDTADAVLIQPDGKIVTAGHTGPAFNEVFFLTRLNSSGSLDISFGNAGRLVTDRRGSLARDIALQTTFSSGGYIVSGSGRPSTNFNGSMMTTARFFGFPRTVLNTGSFDLSPSVAAVEQNGSVNYSLRWTVPDPGSWHDLQTLELRVRDGDEILVQVKLDEATNTLSVYDEETGRFGREVSPGSSGRLQGKGVSVILDDSSVVGTGLTGPTVTLNLTLKFKPSTAGRSYVVEVAASDDFGTSDSFTEAGTLNVEE